MNLFETFGEIFNPSSSLEFYKEKFYQNWVILKHLTPDDALFGCYIDLVDSELEYLEANFNYTPFWKDEYDRFTEVYFAEMEVKKVSGDFKFNLN